MARAPAVRVWGRDATSAGRSPTSSTATTTGRRAAPGRCTRSRATPRRPQFERGVLPRSTGRTGLPTTSSALRPRHDRRHQCADRAQGREVRPDHHRGLPRRAGDRARQPARTCSTSCFAKPAPFVPRHLRREIARAHELPRARSSRRSTRPSSRRSSSDFAPEGVDAVAICLLHAYANSATTRSGSSRSSAGCGPSSGPSWPRTGSRANGASTSAPPPPCCPPTCTRARRAISAGSSAASRE